MGSMRRCVGVDRGLQDRTHPGTASATMRERTRRLALACWFLVAYVSHTVGGIWLDLYGRFAWWHLLTHVLSAGALTAFVQWATMERFDLPRTLAVVFALALAWESFEVFYPGLIFHGWVDFATDMCTDSVGALVGYLVYAQIGVGDGYSPAGPPSLQSGEERPGRAIRSSESSGRPTRRD